MKMKSCRYGLRSCYFWAILCLVFVVFVFCFGVLVPPFFLFVFPVFFSFFFFSFLCCGVVCGFLVPSFFLWGVCAFFFFPVFFFFFFPLGFYGWLRWIQTVGLVRFDCLSRSCAVDPWMYISARSRGELVSVVILLRVRWYDAHLYALLVRCGERRCCRWSLTCVFCRELVPGACAGVAAAAAVSRLEADSGTVGRGLTWLRRRFPRLGQGGSCFGSYVHSAAVVA